MGSRGLMRGILLLGCLVTLLLAHASDAAPGETESTPFHYRERTAEGELRPSRTDPLDGFRKYRGGYNITNLHYWSSAVFTGVYGYGMAVFWLLAGLVYATVLLLCSCFTGDGEKPGNRHRPCENKRCLWLLMLPVLLTLLLIASSGVALAGSAGFHSRAGAVKSKIEETARGASETIFNVTRSVKEIREEGELASGLHVSAVLAAASDRLDGDASGLQRKAEKNVRMIGKGLQILHATTIAIVCLGLVLALGLLGSGFFKLRRTFVLILCLTWVVTSLCWADAGLYFFVDRFAGDTCAALEEFQRDPGNSSLATLLPCDDKLTAKWALRDTRAGISEVRSSAFPGLADVCNPFSAPPEFTYQPENCSAAEIRIGDIPQILKRYACSGGDGGSCGEGEFISAKEYRGVLVYTTSLQNILNSFQAVENLVNCRMVKDAFAEILHEECRPMKRWARMAWTAMAVLSAMASLLVLSWAAIAGHHRRHRSSEVVHHPTENPSPAKQYESRPEAGAEQMASLPEV
ncbi:unnamed protein product [Spirodela intermedia]|uniref:Uncharacterized protein n=1 Tax=Spirodela intermedia TaxID=51605 RepID=A0A7I8KTT5_SPIIN|nr:unnamed protein product [Spirodela intermedia]